MRPTSLRALVLTALVAAAVGYVIARATDAYAETGLPRLSWFTPGVLLFISVLLVIAARTARGWVSHRRYDTVVDAITVARLAAVAKAAAVFGALCVGGYLGFGAYSLVLFDTSAGRLRVLIAACTVGAAALLTAAALWLERSCRVPPDDPDTSPPLTGGTTRL